MSSGCLEEVLLRILAISGSLRAVSSNTHLLRAAAQLAPAGVDVVLYDGLAGLPHFNPDVEENVLPGPVADLRAAVGAADGLLISSPEYAHGVPGALKNALDWIVSSGELVGKPTAPTTFTVSTPSGRSRTKESSIFKISTGRCFSRASDEPPVPKSSNAILRPFARRDQRTFWVRSGSVMAVDSGISTMTEVGSTPLETRNGRRCRR